MLYKLSGFSYKHPITATEGCHLPADTGLQKCEDRLHPPACFAVRTIGSLQVQLVLRWLHSGPSQPPCSPD
eukprot:scaffold1558_cov403-Prasinococcus_capsulatus_cf.AAC.14